MADPVVETPGNPPEPTPVVSGAGDWFESLPPDLKVEKSIQSFKGKGVADVAKSYVEAQKMIGGSIRLPKPDAKPEEREAFMADLSTKLGRPATAADYKKAVTLEALPDGTPWDEAAYDEFLGEMHKAHATPAQVNAAANVYSPAHGRPRGAAHDWGRAGRWPDRRPGREPPARAEHGDPRGV